MVSVALAALIQVVVMTYAVRVMCRADRRRPPVDQRRVIVHLAAIATLAFVVACGLHVADTEHRVADQVWGFSVAVAGIATGFAVYYSTGRRW